MTLAEQTSLIDPNSFSGNVSSAVFLEISDSELGLAHSRVRKSLCPTSPEFCASAVVFSSSCCAPRRHLSLTPAVLRMLIHTTLLEISVRDLGPAPGWKCNSLPFSFFKVVWVTLDFLVWDFPSNVKLTKYF